MVDFQIPARLVSSPAGDETEWHGPPYAEGTPAAVSAWFADYPIWRQQWDHDDDPATPPKDMGPHKGIDMHASTPVQPLHAVADGVVIFCGTSSFVPARGLHVMLDHGDGWQSFYLHLSETSVSTGQIVQTGTRVGVEGRTGWVTGRHVHFALRNPAEHARLGLDPRLNGYVDPARYLGIPGPTPDSAFTPVPGSGFSFVQYAGGTLDEFIQELVDIKATAAFITAGGAWISHIVGAPPFANHQFATQFAGGVPPDTPVMVKKD